MGTKQGIDLTYVASNEEFERMREKIAQYDVEMAKVRAELALRVQWLVEAVKSNPKAVRAALGICEHCYHEWQEECVHRYGK